MLQVDMVSCPSCEFIYHTVNYNDTEKEIKSPYCCSVSNEHLSFPEMCFRNDRDRRPT